MSSGLIEPGQEKLPVTKRGISNRISSPYQTPRAKLLNGETKCSPKISSDPVKEAEDRKERRLAANKKAMEKRQAMELSECTFKPAISKKSLKIGGSARSSWPSLHEPKVISTVSQEPKHVVPEPTIDPYSRILCEQHDRSGPIHDRLMSYGERIRYKKNLLGDQKDLIEMSMSPKKFMSDLKSEKRTPVKSEMEPLNDEYLRGKPISPGETKTAGSPAVVSRQLFGKDSSSVVAEGDTDFEESS